MLAQWTLVESDFHREYGVTDLWAACRVVSWRWFMARVAGLSPDARFVGWLTVESSTVTDPVKAAAILDGALGV